MNYTENFKRQVIKKLLESGQPASELAKKLKISSCSIYRWKKEFSTDFVCIAEEISNRSEVDIDALLQSAEKEMTETKGNTCATLIANGKKASEYSAQDKCVIVDQYRQMTKEETGIFLRKMGLHSRHIELWEKEVLTMAKEKTDKDETIRRLEAEKKSLQKKLKQLEKQNHEMAVIIELKKKYPEIFGRDEED